MRLCSRILEMNHVLYILCLIAGNSRALDSFQCYAAPIRPIRARPPLMSDL
jgi:hypothetical protein